MSRTAAVITVSDKGSRGERTDTAGPAVAKILTDHGYQIVFTTVIPDDFDTICQTLLTCCDTRSIHLVVTTGGTGFSPRDVTPEATLAVAERQVPGLAEAMRAESLKITPMAMLSRATAGLRGSSLILNLPGSEKAAKENLRAVIDPLAHGLDVLLGESGDCAAAKTEAETGALPEIHYEHEDLFFQEGENLRHHHHHHHSSSGSSGEHHHHHSSSSDGSGEHHHHSSSSYDGSGEHHRHSSSSSHDGGGQGNG